MSCPCVSHFAAIAQQVTINVVGCTLPESASVCLTRPQSRQMDMWMHELRDKVVQIRQRTHTDELVMTTRTKGKQTERRRKF